MRDTSTFAPGHYLEGVSRIVSDSQPDTRTRAAALFVVAAIPVVYLFTYGVYGGMPWDYSLTYVSESTPGLKGFLYLPDLLRVYTNVFYNVGYLLSEAMGVQGSWFGYHLIYCMLWVAKGLLVFWLCSLFELGTVIASSAAIVATLHGSDVSIGHVGQINQFGIVVLALLSMCCFLGYLRRKGILRYGLLLIATGASYFALWSHEATLFGLLAYPILFIWITGAWRDRATWIGASIETTPPIVYAVLMGNRLLVQKTGDSFQESVLRSDLSNIGALAHDYMHLLRGLFDVPGWLIGKLHHFNVTFSSLLTARFLFSTVFVLIIIAVFCVSIGRAVYRTETTQFDGRTNELFRLTAALVLLACAFVAPFLALNAGGGYWRTQILAAPFASIVMVMALYFFILHLGRAQSRALAIRAIAYSSTLLAISTTGFAANAVSYSAYNTQWRQIRAPIQRLLATVPDVVPGTIIMLQRVPADGAPWGSNFWFDILVRLAYPNKVVAGAYSFDLANSEARQVKDILSRGGEILNLRDGRRVLVPHGHAYVIDGNRIALAKRYLPPLVESADSDRAIVLEWSKEGPFKIVTNVDEIDLAINPEGAKYHPEMRINRSGPSVIALRRFVE